MSIAARMDKMTAYTWLFFVKGRTALKNPIQPKGSSSSPLPFPPVQHEGCGFPFSCGLATVVFSATSVGGCQTSLCDGAAEGHMEMSGSGGCISMADQ